MLPLSYYNKTTEKITFKLISDPTTTAIKLIYGDPFAYVKTEKLDPSGNQIWDWEYHEAPLTPQYTTTTATMWHIHLPPPKTRRLKYAFIATDAQGQSTFYGEKGQVPPPKTTEEMLGNLFFFPFVHNVDALQVPDWAGNTCWYQIFPERFFNGNPALSPLNTEDWETGIPKYNSFFGGDLEGIIQKLPYLQDLGVTGIYLTPVFESPSNHKYNIQDYFAIDPHFGNTATLKELVSKAHTMGMKVMLDAVFNHIGSKHPFWQDVLKNQEKSQYKDYFHIRSFPVLETYPSRETLNYDTFAFATGMPKWNTENPEARKHLIDSALHWIKECDIDGWRLDVSDEVSFSFWREFKDAVTALKPDFYVLGEIWHDPSKWLNGQYFDAVMNYPLGNAIRDMFVTKKLAPDAFSQELFAKLMKFSDIHSQVQFNLLDSHDTARILTQADGNKLALKNAFLFMLLMKGAPCIYYGTEIGMEGAHDPDCRRPMIWDTSRQDQALAGFFKRLIALRKEYNTLLQNADITYARDKDLCRWSLQADGSRLDIVYNAGNADLKLTGDVLLATHGDGSVLAAQSCAILRQA